MSSVLTTNHIYILLMMVFRITTESTLILDTSISSELELAATANVSNFFEN